MKNINKIFEVKNYLTDTFVGREDVINGVLAGLISGEPTLLVGPPGTAKTSIIDTMSKLINAVMSIGPSNSSGSVNFVNK